jgi:hypothetical protein
MNETALCISIFNLLSSPRKNLVTMWATGTKRMKWHYRTLLKTMITGRREGQLSFDDSEVIEPVLKSTLICCHAIC